MFKKNNKSSGAVSSILLILGVVLIITIVAVFVVIKLNAVKSANTAKQAASQNSNEPPKPVYETQLGDVKFIFESAQNIGSVLNSSDIRFQQNLTTTEKFVKVIVGAQNKGKMNVAQATWGVGNIVDSAGRNFVSVDANNQNYYYVDKTNLCGTLLKPEFEPTPCVKYYEVSKESAGLKVEVHIGNENSSKKNQEGYLDLIVQ